MERDSSENPEVILVAGRNLDEGKRLNLSDLKIEEYDLRIDFGRGGKQDLYRKLFPDEMEKILSSYNDVIRVCVCPSNSRELGGTA